MSRLKIFLEVQSKYFCHENSNWNQNLRSRKNKSEKKKPKIQGGLVGYFPLEDNNRVRNEDLN